MYVKMYNKKIFFILLLLLPVLCYTEARKTRNRGSGRGTSRKTQSPQSAPPTSFSYSQPSAPKPSLFGWQEKPAQRTQISQSKQSSSSRNSQSHSYPSSNGQSKSYPSSNAQSHSYPSSNTGLSGNSNQNKQPQTVKENVQQNSAPQNSHSQSSHGYPSSKGMSGNSGSSVNSQSHQGAGYPSQQGAGYPLQQGVGYQSHGGPPPPYSASKPGDYNNRFGNHQGPPVPNHNFPQSYNGAYGGHVGYGPGYSQSMPGFYGNYANYGKGFGGVSRSSNILSGVGIAGAGVGTILTGLALWNLARSTGRSHHTVIYDNRGQPVAVAPSNNTDQSVDSILGDLVNCSLTISNGNATEILGIPCAIATSFSPDADVKLKESNDAQENTKCTVTVLNKAGKEFMTTIPCSILLKTAAENNVTEPPLAFNVTETTEISFINANGTEIPLNVNGTTYNSTDQPTALFLLNDHDHIKEKNCTPEIGTDRDPINPCYTIPHNLTVIPLDTVAHNADKFTPGSA